jgi:hypothetical protein
METVPPVTPAVVDTIFSSRIAVREPASHVRHIIKLAWNAMQAAATGAKMATSNSSLPVIKIYSDTSGKKLH